MKKLSRFALLSLLALASPALLGVGQAPVRMQGYLRSRTSEAIRPPASEEWSYTILMLAPEGQRVEAGAVVAKLEGQRLKERFQQEQNRYLEKKVEREGKLVEIKTSIDSLEKELADASRELALLEASASVSPDSEAGKRPPDPAGHGDPRQWLTSTRDRLIEKLDIESRQLKLRLTREKLQRKRDLLASITESNGKAADAAEARLRKIKDDMGASERKATKAGVVIYKRSPWERTKPRVGGMAYRGTEVMAIVDDQDLFVEAFLKEEDWARVKVGQPVEVKILGRRESTVAGKIAKVSSIVLKASDWDRSLPASHPLFQTRVFKVELALDAIHPDAKPEGEVEIHLSATMPGEG